jgi:hypothetical protein
MGGYDFRVRPVEVPDVADYQARADAAKARKIELQQRQIELDQAKKAQALQVNQQNAARAAYQPQSYTPPAQSLDVGGANLGYQPAQVQGPAQFNRGSYLDALRQTDPLGAMQQQQQFDAQDIEHQKSLAAYQEQVFKMNKEQREVLNGSLGALDKYFGAVDNAPPQLQPSIYAQAIQAAQRDPDPFVQHMAANAPQQFDPQSWQVIRGQYLDMKRVTEEANKKAELGSKTVQTDAVYQFDPGTGTYDKKVGPLPKTVAPAVNVSVAAKKDATEQAIEAAAQSIASGDLTRLKDISSMRGQDRLLIYNRVKQLNPSFNTSEVDRKIKMLDDFTNGKDGQNLQSFGTFLEHAGEASDVVNQYRASSSPLINKPLNWFKKNASGDPNYIQFVTSLEPVRKEFEGFLLGGKALYGDDRKAAETILSDDSSPAQIQAALKQMGHTVKARYNEANYRYKRVMGTDLQDAVSPEALEGAKKIGVEMGGAKPSGKLWQEVP